MSVGKDLAEIATPALVVDADILEANLKRLADYFADRHCKIRPHFKSHKSVELARRQIAAGSTTGITCSKLAEAEVLVAGGVGDVLIANQVVGPDKAKRLAVLNAEALVRCAVDCAANVDELGTAATAAGVTIGVLVEVEVGMNRCGALPGVPTLDLARHVTTTDGLRFDGLQGYEGHIIYTDAPEERAAKALECLAPLVETRRLIESSGMSVAIVSCGGTGTYDTTGNIEGVDEIQCGSYALMDRKYKTLRPDFDVARWVLATVISAHDDRAVVDVGLKGIGNEFDTPSVVGHSEAEARYVAEEHIPFDRLPLSVGDRVRLIPPHGCTTQNLYRQMWITRSGEIEGVWAIEGAGCLE